jgi:arsenate reductase
MAEALLQDVAWEGVDAFSAGTEPGAEVNPLAVAAMAEIGIDISAQKPKSIDGLGKGHFDWVITVCDHARQTCPVWPGSTHHVYWPILDPAAEEGTDEQRMVAFREVRDDLRDHIRMWVRSQVGSG